MCEEGWCDRLGQEGDCLRERGGNCMKYLERGVRQKKGESKQRFQKEEGASWSCNSVPSKHFLSINLKYQQRKLSVVTYL